eukprot:g82701.t1
MKILVQTDRQRLEDAVPENKEGAKKGAKEGAKKGAKEGAKKGAKKGAQKRKRAYQPAPSDRQGFRGCGNGKILSMGRITYSIFQLEDQHEIFGSEPLILVPHFANTLGNLRNSSPSSSLSNFGTKKNSFGLDTSPHVLPIESSRNVKDSCFYSSPLLGTEAAPNVADSMSAGSSEAISQSGSENVAEDEDEEQKASELRLTIPEARQLLVFLTQYTQDYLAAQQGDFSADDVLNKRRFIEACLGSAFQIYLLTGLQRERPMNIAQTTVSGTCKQLYTCLKPHVETINVDEALQIHANILNKTVNQFPGAEDYNIFFEVLELPQDSHLLLSEGNSETEMVTAKGSTRRHKVALEILQSENIYCRSIAELQRYYVVPLSRAAAKDLIRSEDVDVIFNGTSAIGKLHEAFLADITYKLRVWTEEGAGMGALFNKYAPFFRMYNQYVANHSRGAEMTVQLQEENKYFRALSEAALRKGAQRLSSYLILPIQRIPRYELLLKELLASTDEKHFDYQPLRQALQLVSGIAGYINESTSANLGRRVMAGVARQFVGADQMQLDLCADQMQLDLVTPARRFVRQGRLTKLSRTGKRQIYTFFLFNDLLLYARETRGRFKLHQRLPIDSAFSASNMLLATSPGKKAVNADEEENNLAFQITTSTKSFVVEAPNAKSKQQWLQDMREVATQHWARLNVLGEDGDGAIPAPIYQSSFGEAKECHICRRSFKGLFGRGAVAHCDVCGHVICRKSCVYSSPTGKYSLLKRKKSLSRLIVKPETQTGAPVGNGTDDPDQYSSVKVVCVTCKAEGHLVHTGATLVEELDNQPSFSQQDATRSISARSGDSTPNSRSTSSHAQPGPDAEAAAAPAVESTVKDAAVGTATTAVEVNNHAGSKANSTERNGLERRKSLFSLKSNSVRELFVTTKEGAGGSTPRSSPQPGSDRKHRPTIIVAALDSHAHADPGEDPDSSASEASPPASPHAAASAPLCPQQLTPATCSTSSPLPAPTLQPEPPAHTASAVPVLVAETAPISPSAADSDAETESEDENAQRSRQQLRDTSSALITPQASSPPSPSKSAPQPLPAGPAGPASDVISSFPLPSPSSSHPDAATRARVQTSPSRPVAHGLEGQGRDPAADTIPPRSENWDPNTQPHSHNSARLGPSTSFTGVPSAASTSDLAALAAKPGVSFAQEVLPSGPGAESGKQKQQNGSGPSPAQKKPQIQRRMSSFAKAGGVTQPQSETNIRRLSKHHRSKSLRFLPNRPSMMNQFEGWQCIRCFSHNKSQQTFCKTCGATPAVAPGPPKLPDPPPKTDLPRKKGKGPMPVPPQKPHSRPVSRSNSTADLGVVPSGEGHGKSTVESSSSIPTSPLGASDSPSAASAEAPSPSPSPVSVGTPSQSHPSPATLAPTSSPASASLPAAAVSSLDLVSAAATAASALSAPPAALDSAGTSVSASAPLSSPSPAFDSSATSSSPAFDSLAASASLPAAAVSSLDLVSPEATAASSLSAPPATLDSAGTSVSAPAPLSSPSPAFDSSATSSSPAFDSLAASSESSALSPSARFFMSAAAATATAPSALSTTDEESSSPTYGGIKGKGRLKGKQKAKKGKQKKDKVRKKRKNSEEESWQDMDAMPASNSFSSVPDSHTAQAPDMGGLHGEHEAADFLPASDSMTANQLSELSALAPSPSSGNFDLPPELADSTGSTPEKTEPAASPGSASHMYAQVAGIGPDGELVGDEWRKEEWWVRMEQELWGFEALEPSLREQARLRLMQREETQEEATVEDLEKMLEGLMPEQRTET